jgi:hypothetical protein
MLSAACGLPIHDLQGVSFIVTPTTTVLSHRKPTSAVTSCETCGVQGNYKKRNLDASQRN